MIMQDNETGTGHGEHESPRSSRKNFKNIFVSFRESFVPFVSRSIPGLVAGMLGSLAAIIVMGMLRLTWGTPTLPELLGERVLPLMPADRFVWLLVMFAPDSKTSPLGLALLGQFVLGALLGPAYALAAKAHVPRVRTQHWPDRRALSVAGTFVLGMELVGIAVFWPVLGEGLVGDTIGSARLLTMLAMLLTFLSYAAVTLAANHWFARAWGQWTEPRSAVTATPATQTGPAVARRDALVAVGSAVVAAALGALAIDRLIGAYLARSNLAYEGMSTPFADMNPITKPKDFYVVSKNLLDPVVDVNRWRLEVDGLVDQATTWTYDEVCRLPNETRAVTLECISAGVGSHLMSTAEWTGVLLQTALDRAGVPHSEGKRVAFYSVDGYSTSLLLDEVLAARALLAWEMDGAPLPDRHGFPLRLIMPGRYGEQSTKWLTRIEIIDYHYKGFYESQGWNPGPVSTTSRIDFPQMGRVALGGVRDTTVRGIAYAGIRGIRRVEVSADGGQTWSDAMLQPPLSDQTWVFWRWRPLVPGTYTLVVRATDGTGTVQTSQQRSTVPQGATGWDIVPVTVVS